jgi:CheY-like chemotaxis protein
MAAKKILIVANSAADRQLLLEAMRRQGYECNTANGGAEAVDRAKTEQQDLTLMEFSFPVRTAISQYEGIDKAKAEQQDLSLMEFSFPPRTAIF